MKIKKRKKKKSKEKFEIKPRNISKEPEEVILRDKEWKWTGLRTVFITCGLCEHFYSTKKKKETKICPVTNKKVSRDTDCCLEYKAASKIWCPVEKKKRSQISCIAQREHVISSDPACFTCFAFDPKSVKIIKRGKNYWRVIENKEYPCFKSGYLKDYTDRKVVISHGRFIRRPTKKEKERAAVNVFKKMHKDFPNATAVFEDIEEEQEVSGADLQIKRRSK